MAFFVWNEKLGIRVALIDDQHKKLFSIINDLYESVHSKTTEKTIGKIISELEDYTKYHFSEEEKTLVEYDSPDIALHKQQHQYFVTEIANVKNLFLEGKANIPQSLLSFLRDWLTEHILSLDKKIGGLVESKKKD